MCFRGLSIAQVEAFGVNIHCVEAANSGLASEH